MRELINHASTGDARTKNYHASTEMGTFAQTVKSAVTKKLGTGYQVEIIHSPKNNRPLQTGISICREKEPVSPVIYLEELLNSYQSGTSIREICQRIIRIYETYKQMSLQPDHELIASMHDFEQIKSRICLKLVSHERNLSFLEQAPHAHFQDLAIIFFLLLSENKEELHTTAITDRMMEMWKNPLTEDGLYALALKNTQNLLEIQENPMTEILLKLMNQPEHGIYEPQADSGEPEQMYVITNHLRTNGAAAILYPGFLKSFAERLGQDLFILPSSVHETIIVPDDHRADSDQLLAMVREINKEQVSEEEFLSDNIYHYCQGTDSITLIR